MKNLTFDGMMKELEEIVAMLEAGDVPLEKAMEKYKEGALLISRMDEILQKAKKEIITVGPDESLEKDHEPV
ncbi:MAG: exodeoxyribonuclease VII small subunit [Clostridia bacterium]